MQPPPGTVGDAYDSQIDLMRIITLRYGAENAMVLVEVREDRLEVLADPQVGHGGGVTREVIITGKIGKFEVFDVGGGANRRKEAGAETED